MAKFYYLSVPFDKTAITLALESGVDGIIVNREYVESVSKLARSEVLAFEDVNFIGLESKDDEQRALDSLRANQTVVLKLGWEIIPVENLLAQNDRLMVEVSHVDEAILAQGILERGVYGVVLLPETKTDLKTIINRCKLSQKEELLQEATITRVQPVGLGHRVCVDTLSLLKTGQGMLCGNSSAFTFLVHAETEHNEYVAARPFRINAGGVHAYARLPHDKTCYLQELVAGREVLIVDHSGQTYVATVGRVKIEVRPMLLIEATTETENGLKIGTVFLQNAETIRLTSPEGLPLSVVSLERGDRVLCRVDEPGRHFGMRIVEDIREI
ncbi:MAG: 3-dehydroquinate synthase II family protein [Desulfovibrionaceae bacterium]|nr:3-dehydroquinate synthase II family protein [Desulfovibrionaceae bacterium]